MDKKLMAVRERYLENSEKGSITLFVLVSMLFLTMFLATIFTLSTNSEIAQREATAKIKEIYEVGVDNIDEVYYELAEVKAYDQYGNEIEGFLNNWTYSEYLVDNVLEGWGIKYIGTINSNTGKITGEVPYYIRAGATEKYVVSYDSLFENAKTEGGEDKTKITKLDVSNFNTNKIIDMEYMFKEFSRLTSLDLNSFDTSKVTNMENMFYNCSNLQTLNTSSFNTSEVTNMQYIFYNCKNVKKLDLNGFDTGKVTNMYGIFRNCSSLTELDLRAFNTTKVTTMAYMFSNCGELKNINFGNNFDTTNVTTMRNMFSECRNLISLDVSNFNTVNVTEMGFMFYACELLESLDVSSFNTNKVTNMYTMFNNCTNLKELDLSNFSTQSLKDYGAELISTNVYSDQMKYTFSMFRFCSNLTKLTLGENFKISKGEEIELWNLYEKDSSGNKVEVANTTKSNYYRTDQMLFDCNSELTVYVYDDTTRATLQSEFPNYIYVDIST